MKRFRSSYSEAIDPIILFGGNLIQKTFFLSKSFTICSPLMVLKEIKMKNFKSAFLVASIGLILSNCSTPPECVSLPEGIKNKIGSTDIYVEEFQKNLDADIESSHLSMYSGGGLLFAVADAVIMDHRKDCANNAISEIQKDFKESHIQEKFKSKLSSTFRKTDWLFVNQIHFVKNMNDEKQEEVLKKGNTDGVIIAKLQYKFNPNFDTLRGTLSVSLYPTSIKLKEMIKEEMHSKPTMNFNVSATKTLISSGKGLEENAKIWAQDQGWFLQNALEELLEQICMNTEKVLKDPTHLPGDKTPS